MNRDVPRYRVPWIVSAKIKVTLKSSDPASHPAFGHYLAGYRIGSDRAKSAGLSGLTGSNRISGRFLLREQVTVQ